MVTEKQSGDQAATHTPGALRIDKANSGGGFNIRDAKRRRIAHTTRVGNLDGKFLDPADCIEEPEARANAHRLVACWNACEGIADPSAVPDLLLAAHAASHALKSYEYGNGSPDLARNCAQALDAAIQKAEGVSHL